MVDFEERLERLKLALEALTEKAKEDGIITATEEAILNTAKDRIMQYEALLKNAQEDGIIDDNERNQLNEMEENLYADTYFAGMDDGKIDKDELLLLRTLIKTVDKNASISWLDEDVE